MELKKFCENSKTSCCKIYDIFILFFDTLVEVIEDLDNEKYWRINNDLDESLFNPFYHQKYGSKEKILTQIKEKVLKFVLKLQFEESTLVLSFINIDRLLKVDERLLELNSLYHILTTSLILAQLYNEDNFYSSSTYCKYSETTLLKYNTNTKFFMMKVNYFFYVSESTYK